MAGKAGSGWGLSGLSRRRLTEGVERPATADLPVRGEEIWRRRKSRNEEAKSWRPRPRATGTGQVTEQATEAEAVKQAAGAGAARPQVEREWGFLGSGFLCFWSGGIEARALSKKKGLKALTEFNWENYKKKTFSNINMCHLQDLNLWLLRSKHACHVTPQWLRHCLLAFSDKS